MIVCDWCYAPIPHPKKNQRFCSDSHRVASYVFEHPEKYGEKRRSRGEAVDCPMCDSIFSRTHLRQKYCSDSCNKRAWRKRKEASEDKA